MVVHDGLTKSLVPSPHQSLVIEKVVDLENFPSIESTPFEYIFPWKLFLCEDNIFKYPWSRGISKKLAFEMLLEVSLSNVILLQEMMAPGYKAT